MNRCSGRLLEATLSLLFPVLESLLATYATTFKLKGCFLNSLYKRVFFRIETPSYYNAKYGVGFADEKDSETFNTEALNVFLKDGWQLKEEKYKSSGSGHSVIKDKQELYLHPQSFSGVVKVENIAYLEELIQNGSSMFKLRNTDIYEKVYDISDDEYLKMLESKKAEIELDILEAYKTKRSNLYVIGTSPIEKVVNKHRIKRLSHYVGVYTSSDIEWKYVLEVFESLVNEKRLVTAQTRNGTGYRTDKKLLEKITAYDTPPDQVPVVHTM